jgi:hypothetical protein
MLVRLTYISKPVGDVVASVRDFIQPALHYNHTHQLSAFLVISHDFFFQTIEGNHAQVNSLYKKIVNDHRHTDCNLVEYEVVTELQFPSWDLAAMTLPADFHADGQLLAIANSKAVDLKSPALDIASKKMIQLIRSDLAIRKYLKDWPDAE